jgi:DtxR family Mn-dependent transcriptional regulator
MLRETGREYLETIYNITVEGDIATGALLAQKFGVAPASVTEMLKRLQRDGYLTVQRATGSVLTEQGTVEAEQSLRLHRLTERFLFESLGMDWIAAHVEAHALQRAITPGIEARMLAVLGNPTTCPHGNPIPGSAPSTLDFLRQHEARRLSTIPLGLPMQVLCISEIVEDETGLLRYLGDKDIRPGARITVQDAGPDGAGPLMVEVSEQQVALGRAVAAKVWVWRPEPGVDQARRRDPAGTG